MNLVFVHKKDVRYGTFEIIVIVEATDNISALDEAQKEIRREITRRVSKGDYGTAQGT